MKIKHSKINKQLKSVVGFLSFLFVVGLILFSNCNFRQTLQTHLGVTHTKSLNSVKAPLSTSLVCQSPGDFSSFNATKLNTFSADLLLAGHDLPLELPAVVIFPTTFTIEQGSFSTAIPLYILYRTLKVFI